MKGMEYQLPTYLLTDTIEYGFFVLICYTEDIYNNSEKLFFEAERLSERLGKKIKFKRINATGNLKTASNISKESDVGFDL
jgi:hypothetical protein